MARDENSKGDAIKVTKCKTVTNTKIEHTKHGIVRREVRKDRDS